MVLTDALTCNINISGLKLSYQMSNGTLNPQKPTLLWGHSYLWTSAMWQEQIAALQPHYNCIATDLPAHGASGLWEDKNYSIQRLADLHWQLMEKLEIKTFSVIGLSVGGMWATQLALTHPEAVNVLCLMDTYVGAEPEQSRQKYFSLLDRMVAEGFTEEMLNIIVKYFLTEESIANRPQLVERFKSPLRQLNKDHQRRAHLCELGRYIFNRTSLLEQLSSLTMPVHIIVGRDDVPRPVFESERMVSKIRNGELTVIEKAGHICNVEQAELVTQVLKGVVSLHDTP